MFYKFFKFLAKIGLTVSFWLLTLAAKSVGAKAVYKIDELEEELGLMCILGGIIMTKEEFNKEYNRVEYRYAELKQYKKLYDNAEELKCKLKTVHEMRDIHHIAIYKNLNNFIEFYNLTDAAQASIKTIIENDLEDILNKINQKIEEINL